uniref:Uncharacterized protein n=1 Tax=viral metagenome TaxID=1070528 RepID=A0A6H1ZKM1_9ZZZZ
MKKFKVLSIFLAVIMLAGIAFAETPSTLKRNVWNAKQTFKHGVEITGTGDITATNIADVTRSIQLPLAAAIYDNAGSWDVIGNDGTTSPGIDYVDGIPAIIYATSAETASIAWTFIVPADYSSGLSFRMMVSSSSNTSYDSLGLDWVLFVNNFSTAFDAAAFAQTAVANTNAFPATSNVLLTFTADATAAADIAAGDVVTVGFFNNDGRTVGATTEIKAVEGRYTAIQ